MSVPTRRYHLPSALRPSSLRIETAAAQSLVGEGALLVDVRRKEDLAHPLTGAVRVPPDEIPAFLHTLPPGVAIVLACT
jgi:rhodanese-related sulfurtransferase